MWGGKMPTSSDDQKPKYNNRYFGLETKCYICQHKFIPGDVIYFDHTNDLIVCYYEREPILPGQEIKNCYEVWNKRAEEKTPRWEPMIFTGTAKYYEKKQNVNCYLGEKLCCDFCGHKFSLEEPLIDLRDRDLIFCYQAPDPYGAQSCFGRWRTRENPSWCQSMVLYYWGKGCLS
jgi:hypothetical protein